MSGRIGDLKTAGSGCVEPLGEPSAFAMVTVGRVVMLAVLSRCRRRKFWNMGCGVELQAS